MIDGNINFWQCVKPNRVDKLVDCLWIRQTWIKVEKGTKNEMEVLLNYFGEGCYVWEISSSICEILQHGNEGNWYCFSFSQRNGN